MSRLRLFFHQLRHWEYWPFGIVYLPVYFVWLYYALRSRTVFFFLPSNPSIKNAGFLLESKKEIYDILPADSYPATVLVKKGSSIQEIKASMKEAGISFPCIAKPDIGMKGLAVERIHSATELMYYNKHIPIDYLVQALVTFPHELGIFYYRMPGEAKGKISGIVQKEFLTVTGDGESTVLQLIRKEPRFLLQLSSLQKKYGAQLQDVPEKNETLQLVPFGNHARGARFIDATILAEEKLNEVIDRLCQQVPGFYYGRLDIRYNSLEELRQGKNFSIIELNGAGSEPTHIYDPGHSVLFAWKEIARHLRLLFLISKKNNALGFPHMNFKAGMQLLKENKQLVKKLQQYIPLQNDQKA